MFRRGKNVAIGRKTPPQGEKSTGKRFEDGVTNHRIGGPENEIVIYLYIYIFIDQDAAVW